MAYLAAMVLISDVLAALDACAPAPLQEAYDNSGLLTGKAQWTCQGTLCTLDVTPAVLREAIAKGCNLVVEHKLMMN